MSCILRTAIQKAAYAGILSGWLKPLKVNCLRFRADDTRRIAGYDVLTHAVLLRVACPEVSARPAFAGVEFGHQKLHLLKRQGNVSPTGWALPELAPTQSAKVAPFQASTNTKYLEAFAILN